MRVAGEKTFDIIPLDLLMPAIGGVEALGRIRADSANQATPVITVSVPETPILARDDVATIEQAQSLGANAVVFKPFTHAALISAVNAQLEERK